MSWSVKWDPDYTVSGKHTTKSSSILLLIKMYPPQVSPSASQPKSLQRCYCRLGMHSWELRCSLGDVFVLFAARHSCIRAAIVWRNPLLLMQTLYSKYGNSVLEAWHILEPSLFILPRQLPLFQVCPSLVTVCIEKRGRSLIIYSIPTLAQTSRGSEWWI